LDSRGGLSWVFWGHALAWISLSFEYVLRAGAGDIAQGFLALWAVPVGRILAWVAETVTAKNGQAQGQDYQQSQPFK